MDQLQLKVGSMRVSEGDFEIHTFGELEILRRGARVELPQSKKARALLGYLAATARPHLRSTLCDLLWDGPEDPRGSLRWSLSRLRASIGDRLSADRNHVSIEQPESFVDVLQVQRRLAPGIATLTTADLIDVEQMFRGDFLAGLELWECHRFHEWCAGARELWRSRWCAIAEMLVSRLSKAPVDALRYARRWAALDPINEGSHLSIVRLLHELGRRDEALAECENTIRLLDLEAGASPSRALLDECARLERSRARRPPLERFAIELGAKDERR
jgi:DNA-binding SARP family transcriptional activator